ERDQEMQEMRARIAALEELVEGLRTGRESTGGPLAAAVPAPAAQTQVANPPSSHTLNSSGPTLAEDHQDHSTSQAEPTYGTEHTYPALHFSGFGNMNFSATDDPTTKSGFNLGQFILHVASPLSPKVSAFGEISFTAAPTSYTLDVER